MPGTFAEVTGYRGDGPHGPASGDWTMIQAAWVNQDGPAFEARSRVVPLPNRRHT